MTELDVKFIEELFDRYSKEVIMPYVETTGLIAQQAIVILFKEMLKNSYSRNDMIDCLEEFEKYYKEKIEEANKNDNQKQTVTN